MILVPNQRPFGGFGVWKLFLEIIYGYVCPLRQ